MISIERFNGREELDKLLEQFVSIPTNTEIVERTGFSKGSVSGIMNRKMKPSEDFVEKFKKGFKIDSNMTIVHKANSPLENGKDSPQNIVSILKNENEDLKSTVSFLQENVKSLLEILKSKQ